MGNCFCQLHIHPEKEIINQNDNQENNSNFLRELNSEMTNRSIQRRLKNPKINEIIVSIKKKLIELGNFIPIKEFNDLIGNEIMNEIKQKKFDSNQYITASPSSIFNLEPFKFKDTYDIYYGSWNEDAEMEGNGIFYSSKNKIIIEGVWIRGDNVCGRIFFPSGDIYEGAITNSLPNGKGELIMSNKDKYIGEFKKGEMVNGQIYFGDDGTKFEGFIENGNFNGKGKMNWRNVIEYEGDFENSMLTGKGKITKIIDINKKEIYEGDFYENEFHGKGKYHFSNGDIYEGDFEFGNKKGYGIYNRNSGNVVRFEGKWNNDLPNGNGELIYGEYRLKGFWRNGVYMNSTEETNEIFNTIDTNIIPQKISIFPSSLSHINIGNSNISHYTQDFI